MPMRHGEDRPARTPGSQWSWKRTRPLPSAVESPHRHAGNLSGGRWQRQPGHAHGTHHSWKRCSCVVGQQFTKEARRDPGARP
eukprot:4088039-Pyramimonas_sp.AAC.1